MNFHFLIMLHVHVHRQGTLLHIGPEIHRLQWETSLAAVVEKESMENHGELVSKCHLLARPHQVALPRVQARVGAGKHLVQNLRSHLWAFRAMQA